MARAMSEGHGRRRHSWGNPAPSEPESLSAAELNYDLALHEIAALDTNFYDELSTFNRWFLGLSEPRRTAGVYHLLQGWRPTLLQIRFFLSLLEVDETGVTGGCQQILPETLNAAINSSTG
ncbi:hypothetical protein B0H13DRAFT_595970 [Mycena leptocephala]|nr:hypothetical protein B0H13DRAFT_595970 [Mycena leptocephala]